MDNAADALKMAGSVLLFVLALSIVVPLFTEARITADTIMDYADREAYQNNADDSMDKFFFYVGDDSKKVRTVGLDTIIPAIYRSFKENDKVVFVENASETDSGTELWLYECQYGKINSIDLKYTSIPAGRGNDEKKKQFLNGILYGVFHNTKDDFEKEFLPGEDGKVELKDIITKEHGLYGYLKRILDNGGEITEYLGVYYQEDVDSIKDRESSESIEDAINKIPEAQKDEKRVITYSIR